MKKKMERGNKIVSILMILMVAAFGLGLSSCATSTQQSAAGWAAGLGALGTALGYAIGGDAMGAAIGGAAGLAAGAMVGTAIDQANRLAVQKANRYGTGEAQVGNAYAYAKVLDYNPVTKCKKIHRFVTENGKVVVDRVEEVCEGHKAENKY